MPISYLFLPPSPFCRKFYSIVPLCRKSHSSPRPSAFLWATFYPTQKRWLYQNVVGFTKTTKRKCVLSTVEQKFQIVSRIEAYKTSTKLPKEFGVGISTVGDMRRDSEKIKRFDAASNGKSAKLLKTMKCANVSYVI
ncbi:hypothetical protein AVEN_115248-1 [Araneus ventricosus]|uniref:HTH psq-type domain-containing protein n=1 Tax=Araneus ventricosus TaxID=182803 RepID=A0A4Y1ZY05_ARAVE|nr:hypothetical protein AVEN_115248-1 [Araneus ventricosus]